MNYSYETGQHHRPQRGVDRHLLLCSAGGLLTISSLERSVAARRRTQLERLCTQSVRLRFAAARHRAAAGRSARSRRRSSTTRSTTRSSRRTGKKLHGVGGSGGVRRQHAVLQASRRGHLVLPAHQPDVARPARPVRVHRAAAQHDSRCRSSSGCSSAASTASAASTSGRSGRRCRIRWSCSAATRACSSTRNTSFTIAQPVRLLLFYDAGQVRDFGEPFSLEAGPARGWSSRRRRRSSDRSANIVQPIRMRRASPPR